jgi:hypothetical protein
MGRRAAARKPATRPGRTVLPKTDPPGTRNHFTIYRTIARHGSHADERAFLRALVGVGDAC